MKFVPVSVSVNAAPPTAADVGAMLVSVGAGLLTVMLKFCVAAGLTPFEAVTVPLNVPAAVGVPEIVPVLLSVRPVGKAPLVMLNVGAGLPVAVYVNG